MAAYWHTYRAHLPEIRALGEAAQVDPAFAESLAAMRHAGLATMRRHLERLRDTGHALPGDPAVLASAFNALLEGFCQVWIAGGGEPIGRPLGDREAIDTLTRLLLYGLAGQRQEQRACQPGSPRGRPPARSDRRAGRRPPSAMPLRIRTDNLRAGTHIYLPPL